MSNPTAPVTAARMTADRYLSLGYWPRREHLLFEATEPTIMALLEDLRAMPDHPWLEEAIVEIESALDLAVNGPNQ